MSYPLTHRQFFNGLKEGRLQGLKCADCGAYTAPPKVACAECGGRELTVVELSGRGTIRTYTVIRVAPEGFTAPYVVAMAEMEEGPWLMGNVAVEPDSSEGSLIGRKVTVGHRLVEAGNYTAGEGVAVTFDLVD
ncbi:MAG TPA: Zn-ribbon domain-containing OB-fold protein [Spirochaetia bacterium]|nr:Zn-ribbon domain-containing OB-fold protein [Spirochaetia bacterium]